MSLRSRLSLMKKGFTLTELLIVILIIALLMAFLLPQLLRGPSQARDLKRQTDVERLATLMETYRNSKGSLPEAGCILADSSIGKELITLNLISTQNFPKDPSESNEVSGNCRGGYLFTPIRANGIEKNGFIISAKVENKANGNYQNNGQIAGENIVLKKGDGNFFLKLSE